MGRCAGPSWSTLPSRSFGPESDSNWAISTNTAYKASRHLNRELVCERSVPITLHLGHRDRKDGQLPLGDGEAKKR